MKIKKKTILTLGMGICALSLLAGGCSDGTQETIETTEAMETETTETETTETEAAETAAMKITELAKADYPQEPVFDTEDERREYSMEKRMNLTETFQNSYGAFAVNSASQLLGKGEENQVYCPLSLYYALALTAEGAEGETQQELLQVLGAEDSAGLAEECRKSFEALYHVSSEENKKENEWGELPRESLYQLQIANSLWADDSVEIKPEYAERGAQYYYADLFQADLQAPETAEHRSQWVQERTNGRITPSGEPAGDQTVLSIMNTVYFYDEWIHRFDETKTAEDTFTCADGTEVTCDFMNMELSSHGFRKGENYTESSLSLKNSTMTFYLPDEGVSVEELVKDAETLQRVLEGDGQYTSGQTIWKVPKFSYGSHMELSDMLKSLGVEQAFTENADFSNMTDSSPMWISNVVQDAHLGIDENGVEGAAFTEIMFAGAALPKGRADMILDRPFLYTVKNNGVLVFIGICGNPAEM